MKYKAIPPHMPNMALPYVMHIDLNSCFAIIEQQANRLLRGKPVGVSAYATRRGFLLAASYEAKRKGVKLGVNNEQAQLLCPGIIILTPDPPKYREAHRRFKEVLLEYSPDVMAKSIDEFVVDFSKSEALKSSREQLVMSREMAADFSGLSTRDSRLVHNEIMLQIGLEIKQKIRERLGEYVTVNIGISTNRFLAKYAAGFDKPDGMTLIDHETLVEKYTGMKLVDLPGINVRYRARLRAQQIFTPLDFLAADARVLQKQVFKSIAGYHWYRRLRGYEADAVEFSRKSIGHQYALPDKTTDIEKLERLLMKLCEKTGRRLRKNSYYATGIHLYLGFVSDTPRALDHAFDQPTPSHAAPDQFFPQSRSYDYALSEENQSDTRLNQARSDRKRRLEPDEGPSSFENMHNIRSWHHGEKVHHRLYATSDIYEAAKRLLRQAEIPSNVKIMSIHVFGLQPWDPQQLSLFESHESRVTSHEKKTFMSVEKSVRSVDVQKRVSDAVDAINNRYGEFLVTPAAMMDMQKEILDRIAFGQVRDL